MSISILNRGGASGGLKPELTVTAPSGSTIDLLQNGIIVDTYTLGASETEHTFVVKIGTYTVSGTLGTSTSSVEVVIDAVAQYSLSIKYALYLYNKGDECEEVTGGWNNTITNNPSAGYSLAKYGTYMQSNSWSVNVWVARTTSSLVDITEYSKIFVEVEHTAGSSLGAFLGLYSSIPTSWKDPDKGAIDAISASAGTKLYEMNVSAITGKVCVCVAASHSNLRYVKVWLE